MRKLFPPVLLLSCATAVATCFADKSSSSSSDPDEVVKAREFVDRLQKEEYEQAVKQFDDAMLAKVPADKLKEVWEGLAASFGKFKQTGKPRSEKVEGYFFVFIPCAFQKATLDAKVVFKDGKITGLFFTPSAVEYKPPKYVKEDAFQEIQVKFGAEEWRLPGTLRMPKGDGPFPALILVHGSGANDRDETVFGIKPLRDLAAGLASQDIAVLAYDKRTFVHGAKIPKKFTVKEEVIDDVVMAVEMLQDRKDVDPKRIFILGHSLGGMLIPRIAERTGQAAGFIVMSGPARPLEDLLLEQNIYLLSLQEKPTDKMKEQLEALKKHIERIKAPDLSPDTPAEELVGAPATYWLDLRDYQPAVAAAKIKQPLLVLQGERDYQVTMADFALWKKQLADKKTVQLKSYPKLNHLMMAGEGKSKPDEYTAEGHVDQEVIDDIARWIKKL